MVMLAGLSQLIGYQSRHLQQKGNDMAHEFKAGDLALVVGAVNADSPNIGKSVELITYARYGDLVEHTDGSRFKYIGHGGWLAIGEGIMMRERLLNGSYIWADKGGSSFFDARHLMPLRGDFQLEQKNEKEAEPCA